MKKLLFVPMFVLFSSFSMPSSAQFFKKLGDKIEKNVEKRLDRKTDQVIDKTLDKAETGTEKAVNDAVRSSEEHRGKQASGPQGPGKTADPLPENYTLSLTGSGPDLYLEYRMEMATAEAQEMDMDITMKMYAAPSKGGGRSEVTMQMPVIGEMNMVMLTNFKDPNHVILLNERKEKYAIMNLSDVEEAGTGERFVITKLGEEKIHGLHAIHARAVSEDGQEFEIWTSREIPGYEDMLELYSKNQRMGSDNLWKALQEAGCAGFMIKLKVKAEGGASIMELTKVKKTHVPESMLLVPAGYKESNGPWTKRYLKR